MASVDNPNRSPRALPLPDMELLPDVTPRDQRPNFDQKSRMSPWRQRNGRPHAGDRPVPRVILAYAKSKRRP
jgi:hypothetical protein